LESFKAENEMLAIQLEERTQDVEMLEKRLNAETSGVTGSMFAISKNAANNATEDDQPTSQELEAATAKLAEQMILINHLEVEVAECHERIEQLQTEKAQLNQKLAIMQRIKSDYDELSAKYEKIQSQGGSPDTQAIIDQLRAEKDDLLRDFESVSRQKVQLMRDLEDLDELQDQLEAEKAAKNSLQAYVNQLEAQLGK
jgi:predicted nuclease with TOPRIM domain